jgi:hypothetical protein
MLPHNIGWRTQKSPLQVHSIAEFRFMLMGANAGWHESVGPSSGRYARPNCDWKAHAEDKNAPDRTYWPELPVGVRLRKTGPP